MDTESKPKKFTYFVGVDVSRNELVGTLNADDFFADENILNTLADTFAASTTSIVYGDPEFVGTDGRTVRYWQSGDYSPSKLNWGWMPPHPTFYCSVIAL